MANPKKLTADQKIDVLSKHIGVLHNLIKEQRIAHHRQLNLMTAAPAPALHAGGMHAAPMAAFAAAAPARPQVLATVIRTLKDAEIMNNASEFDPLTDRFNEVRDEDKQMGHPGFRIGRFIDILHNRLQWNWDLGQPELLDGTLPNAAAITDNCLATA